ncbi:MAG: hypothetical protein GTN81_03140 [Proteobacteria bacterium]|nr:hypothetical protein [Pseudomonadota bacterium]
MSNRPGVEAALLELNRAVGIERLFLIHLNETKVPLGSHKDRTGTSARGTSASMDSEAL